MTRPITVSLVLATVAVPPLWGDEKPDKSSDAEALQGKWIVECCHIDGYELKATGPRTMTVTFKDDRVIFQPKVTSDWRRGWSLSTATGFNRYQTRTLTLEEGGSNGSFKLNSEAEPKKISMTTNTIDKKKKKKKVETLFGIYKLTRDRLTICLSPRRAPAKFEPDPSILMLELQRPEKTEPVTD